MGSNRKRPFGYRMELGESVLHPAEAETVRWIYDSYLAGASYNALVDKLQERGIPRRRGGSLLLLHGLASFRSNASVWDPGRPGGRPPPG